jgi:hypothetical protein
VSSQSPLSLENIVAAARLSAAGRLHRLLKFQLIAAGQQGRLAAEAFQVIRSGSVEVLFLSFGELRGPCLEPWRREMSSLLPALPSGSDCDRDVLVCRRRAVVGARAQNVGAW